MSRPNSAIYNYIVKELAPTEHEQDEAPITIICEPHSVGETLNPRGAISMRLQAGTTLEEAQAIASKLQAKVKGLCHLEAPGDMSTTKDLPNQFGTTVMGPGVTLPPTQVMAPVIGFSPGSEIFVRFNAAEQPQKKSR